MIRVVCLLLFVFALSKTYEQEALIDGHRTSTGERNNCVYWSELSQLNCRG